MAEIVDKCWIKDAERLAAQLLAAAQSKLADKTTELAQQKQEMAQASDAVEEARNECAAAEAEYSQAAQERKKEIEEHEREQLEREREQHELGIVESQMDDKIHEYKVVQKHLETLAGQEKGWVVPISRLGLDISLEPVLSSTAEPPEMLDSSLEAKKAHVVVLDKLIDELHTLVFEGRLRVLKREMQYYNLQASSLAEQGISWEPASLVGIEGTNDWPVAQFEALSAEMESSTQELTGANSALAEQNAALRAEIVTLFPKPQSDTEPKPQSGTDLIKHMTDTDLMSTRVDGEYVDRTIIEFEQVQMARSALKMARVQLNMTSAEGAKLGAVQNKLKEQLVMYQALDKDIAGLYGQACSFVKQNRHHSAEINSGPYESYTRTDKTKFVKYFEIRESECCRMLGTVNGRNEFALGTGLQWGEDGKLML